MSVTANNPLASHLKAVTDTIKLYDKRGKLLLDKKDGKMNYW